MTRKEAAQITPITHATLTREERRVLRLLEHKTYEEIVAKTGWSKGRIWALAVKMGCRKTEARIRERDADRRRRQREYFQQMINSTAKADVLDFLDGIPDNSIKMHFTSSPYNMGVPYGDGASADDKHPVFFHGWLMQIISELARTVMPGGVVCLNTGKTRDWQDQLMPMDILIFEDMRCAGLTFQDRIVWPVATGKTTPKNRLAGRYETILVFSKGEQVTFNPNAVRMPQKHPDKRAYKGPNKNKLSCHPLGAYPTDVWSDIPPVGHNHPDTKHGRNPAQFPVKLAKRAMLLYTMPGDVTCDIFSGGGALAVAAKESGRSFVGCDLFYEDLRQRRIDAAVPDLVTPLTGVTDRSVAIWQAEARRVHHVAKPISGHADLAMCAQLGFFDAELPQVA